MFLQLISVLNEVFIILKLGVNQRVEIASKIISQTPKLVILQDTLSRQSNVSFIYVIIIN